MKRAPIFLTALAALAIFASGCGYHLQGAGTIPARDIYLQPFVNRTDKLDLAVVMTAAVREELAHRARGPQPDSPAGAGAILSGEITYYGVTQVTLDPRGQANRYEVTVTARVKLVGKDGKELYQNERFLHREVYERPEAIQNFYDQEPQARQALAAAFAKDLMDTIAENY
jgi:outer membrane lipopolysaccharide assembly protein LptE/RlpB